MIGGADRILVMLHHQHRVAQALEPLQRAEQALIVALVQADARLVQHVEHAGQARADLAREPDALALAAGERRRAARQGEVIEPDIDQELQPLIDLAQNPPGDFQPLRRQRVGHAGKPVARGRDRHLRHFGEMFARHLYRQRLGLQPRALADGAWPLRLVAGQLLAHPDGIGFAQTALEIFDDAFERLS